ncbi:MAG: hypothetical protein KBC66_00105 [Kiritimatiellae bacterium]|jgi:hypothetical protein|nr:hypothetical protein [Kiritimatiellia bacterium]HQQ61267.1 hypothetical protein [Kiritimatiellia bacterium]
MSTPIILRDFKFTRDFRQIRWGATLGYNLLRSLCAGIVIGVIMLVFPQAPDERMTAVFAPLIWPIGYICMFLPLGLVCSLLRGLPFVGIIAAFFSIIAVSLGDPLVCLIHKIFPKAVPVDAPPLFSLYLIFWVLDAPEISLA